MRTDNSWETVCSNLSKLYRNGTKSSCAYRRHLSVKWFYQSYCAFIIYTFKVSRTSPLMLSLILLFQWNTTTQSLLHITWVLWLNEFWLSSDPSISNAFCLVNKVCMSCYTVAAHANEATHVITKCSCLIWTKSFISYRE
jgi:hypothetical protein